MEGDLYDKRKWGLVPRIVHDIFDQMNEREVDFRISVSMVEIYNEVGLSAGAEIL